MAGMIALPRRRWFQFSITSLFVVTTLVAVWLAWELAYIRERQAWVRDNAALVDEDDDRASVNLGPISNWPFGPVPQPLPKVIIDDTSGRVSFSPASAPPVSLPHKALIPRWRKWLGDAPITTITERDDWADAERANVVRLFPEAELIKPPVPVIRASASGFLHPIPPSSQATTYPADKSTPLTTP
jgi:hypothetical protein